MKTQITFQKLFQVKEEKEVRLLESFGIHITHSTNRDVFATEVANGGYSAREEYYKGVRVTALFKNGEALLVNIYHPKAGKMEFTPDKPKFHEQVKQIFDN